MYKYLLFDLDGTLTESGPGIMNAAKSALQYYGIEGWSEEELKRFIGPPLKDSFMNYCGFDEEKAVQAIVKFREYYTTKGWCENKPYEHVPEMLETLHGRGYKLIVATSKIEAQAVRICEHFGLSQYLDDIVGSDDGNRALKKDVINFVLDKYDIRNKDEAIMIGDREHDILGAKATGIDSMGVLYGYGSRGELEAAGADLIADTVDDIKGYFTGVFDTE
ncbi:MAG: HAD-IA family hydrolase [Lachnospiraceae bacterium]|nr:HAD-IA family hydrolase [Lachnospiraceae bacterium]